MNASFGQRNLIDDFVLGDRRLGDIRGIKVAVRATGSVGGGTEPIQAHPMVPIQMVWRYREEVEPLLLLTPKFLLLQETEHTSNFLLVCWESSVP